MSIAFLVCIVVVVLAVYRLILFLKSGGSYTLPAVNSTHMYYQIKRVYPKLPDGCAMFMALLFNSASARNKLSAIDILRFVCLGIRDGKDWETICSSYCYFYATRIGHSRISPEQTVRCGMFDKVIKAISRAKADIESGNNRYEEMLRSLPQVKVMQILMMYEEGIDGKYE